MAKKIETTTTIKLSSDYAGFHPVAIGLKVGGNSAAIIRTMCESIIDNAEIRDEMVEIWEHSEAMDNVAVMRSTLSRESKKVLGFGLTVKDGKLVQAATREKKASQTSMFIRECQEFAAVATPEDLAMALQLMQNILRLPKAN